LLDALLESKLLWRQPCIFLVLGNLFLILCTNLVSGQGSGQSSELSKIQNGSQLLTDQIKNNEYSIQHALLIQVLPTIGAVSVPLIAAFFAWQHERRKLLPAQEEEIFQNLVKQWYYTSYLDFYKKMWNKIQNSQNDVYADKLVDSYWEGLCIKDFSLERFPDLKEEAIDPKNMGPLISYVKRRFGYKDTDEKEIRQRIQFIQNIAEVDYHYRVRTVLPEMAEIAVNSALGPKTTNLERDWDELVEKSIKGIKRLMIFHKLSEDKKVVETLIRSKLREKIFKS
jgi:hypothetical protein